MVFSLSGLGYLGFAQQQFWFLDQERGSQQFLKVRILKLGSKWKQVVKGNYIDTCGDAKSSWKVQSEAKRGWVTCSRTNSKDKKLTSNTPDSVNQAKLAFLLFLEYNTLLTDSEPLHLLFTLRYMIPQHSHDWHHSVLTFYLNSLPQLIYKLLSIS